MITLEELMGYCEDYFFDGDEQACLETTIIWAMNYEEE